MVEEFKDNCYEERLHKLNLMSTETRREWGDQIMCYKILNNKVKVDEHVLIKAKETNKRAQHEANQNNHGFGYKDELLQQSG